MPTSDAIPTTIQAKTEKISNLDSSQGGAVEEEENDITAQPYLEYDDPAKSSKRFGLRGSVPYRIPKGNDPFNYEENYPEDAYGEEMGPSARVFRTYLDERAIYDANMVEEARDGVDVLLVFAGLFSAVVTTFVVQTSQSLQADYAEMSANLLFEMINIQRAIASGASLDTVTASPLNPNITFIASTTSVWVNGLWFTSLALSLTTALVSVLVKQWLHHYIALPSGTPRERSVLRQFRFAGLQKWHVLVIIGLLPVLMHTALAIFFVGLVIFLGPLRDSLAWVIGAITAIAYMAYLMAHILPLIFPQCPYRTSLCDLLHVLYSHMVEYTVLTLWRGLRRTEMNTPDTVDSQSVPVARWKDLKELESDAVQSVQGELSVEALHWLFSMSSNPTVQSIVVQAIGGLHPAFQRKAKGLFDVDIYSRTRALCEWCLSTGRTPQPGLETKLERLLRCKLFFSDQNYLFINLPQTPSVELPSSVTALIEKSSNYPGVNLLMKRIALNRALAFRRSSGIEYLRLHPLVWIDLIRKAASKGVFSPIDIGTEDPFTMNICCTVLPAYWFPYLDNDPNDKAHSTAIDIHVAIHCYFFTDMTTYLLEMFAVFVHPSNVDSVPPSLRVLLVFAEFLVSKLPLKEQVNPDAEELHALAQVIDGIENHVLSSQANAAVFDVLERFFTDNLKMIPMMADTHLYSSALMVYSRLFHKRWHTVSPRSLEVVVNLMLDNRSYSSSASNIVAEGLYAGSPAMYSVFCAKQCLEYFGHHGYHPWWVNIIESYISTIGDHSKFRLEPSVEREHIDYLHIPDNLFVACSILAVGSGDPYASDHFDRRKQTRENILSLVRIQQDNPVWDECRCRLQRLLEEDGMGFFYRQASIRGIERDALSGEIIAKQREYIRFAIKTLDAFFSGELDEEPISDPPVLSVDVLPNPRPHWSSRMHRLLPWHNHEASDGGAVGSV